MKAENVKVNSVYVAKVSGKLVNVKIISLSERGRGYVAENLSTGRRIYLKSAARLRYLAVSDEQARQAAI